MATTIVFDFEDGLQGWELDGSAQRVQTQLLGGEWAIFGDGFLREGASLSRIIEEVSVELFPLQISHEVSFDILIVAGDGTVVASPSLVGLTEGVFDLLIQWQHVNRGPPVAAFIDNITLTPVPEPAATLLLAASLATVIVVRARLLQVGFPCTPEAAKTSHMFHRRKE